MNDHELAECIKAAGRAVLSGEIKVAPPSMDEMPKYHSPKYRVSRYYRIRKINLAKGLTTLGKVRQNKRTARPTLAGLIDGDYHREYMRLIRAEQRKKYGKILY